SPHRGRGVTEDRPGTEERGPRSDGGPAARRPGRDASGRRNDPRRSARRPRPHRDDGALSPPDQGQRSGRSARERAGRTRSPLRRVDRAEGFRANHARRGEGGVRWKGRRESLGRDRRRRARCSAHERPRTGPKNGTRGGWRRIIFLVLSRRKLYFELAPIMARDTGWFVGPREARTTRIQRT